MKLTHIKIHSYVYVYIFSLMIFILVNFNSKSPLSMDEIWCYGFSKNIADGFVPYRDYNVIQTPLFFMIGAFFSKSLILFRLYGALIDSAIIVLTYHVCVKNKIDINISAVYTALIGILLLSLGFANYNKLLVLLIMISYLTADNFFSLANTTNSFLMGFSLSAALLVKQNLPGILIIIITCALIYMIITRKMPFKSFVYYMIGGILPISLFTIYLLWTSSFEAFIDYSILGLFSFSENKITEKGFQVQYIIALISAIITILLIAELFKKRKEGGITKHMNAVIFSICSYIAIYPIIDKYHTTLTLILNIVLSIELIRNTEMKLFSKPSVKYIAVAALFCYALLSFWPLNSEEQYVRSDMAIYRGIFLEKRLEENIKVISNYIKVQENKGLDVAIIHRDAYAYTLPADDHNGILDLLSIGNVGTKNEMDIISLIDQKDIILTNTFYGYQDIRGFREYVIRNFSHDGNIEDMEIYKNYEE